MSGREVAEGLLGMHSGLKVLFMSGYTKNFRMSTSTNQHPPIAIVCCRTGPQPGAGRLGGDPLSSNQPNTYFSQLQSRQRP